MKLVSKSLADQVYDQVKEMILSGHIKQGEKISEENLSEQFEVSRTPIREALKRLDTYGLVKMEPRSHTSVIEISEKGGKDIALMRINLENFAIDHINMGLFNSSFDEICRLAADCQYALTIENRAKAFELDSLFHIAIIKTADNDALTDIYERIDAKIQLLRIKQNENNDRLLEYMMQHTKLINLIKNGRLEEAKALTENHVLHKDGLVL